jgi:hypothetical protein
MQIAQSVFILAQYPKHASQFADHFLTPLTVDWLSNPALGGPLGRAFGGQASAQIVQL